MTQITNSQEQQGADQALLTVVAALQQDTAKDGAKYFVLPADNRNEVQVEKLAVESLYLLPRLGVGFSARPAKSAKHSICSQFHYGRL